MATDPTLVPGASNQNGVVAESDFSYQPPAYQDESGEARDALDGVIGEIQGEFADEEAAKWLTPEAGKTDESEQSESDPTQPESTDSETGVQPEDEQVDPKTEKTFERVVQRELAAREAEAKLASREAQVNARLAELKGLEGKLTSKQLEEKMAVDPLGAFKAMGHDPSTIIRLALAQEVMEKGPPTDPGQLKTYNELKEFARDASMKREIAQLRAENEAQKRAVQEQQYFNAVAAGGREYVKTLGASTPTLLDAYKVDPEAAYSEIMEEISRDARDRMTSDPSGEPLTYAEAAKKVESRLAKYKKLFGAPAPVQPGPNSKPPAIASKAKPTQTPPTAAAPARPLKPWEANSQNDLVEAGIQEALREYHTKEAAARQIRR